MPKNKLKTLGRGLTVVLSFFILPSISLAQTQGEQKVYTHELELTSDNDVYLFNLYDKYYTNGAQLSWRHVLPDSSGLLKRLNKRENKVSKAIIGLSLSQKIYSPEIIYTRRLTYLDRPYAGWLYLTGSASFFLKNKDLIQAGLDVGVTGKPSAGEWLQKNWHHWFGLPQPRNWEYQIREQVTSHVNISWQHQSIAFKGGDLISESALQAGTLMSNLRQNATLRLGKTGPLSHSSFTNSRLGAIDGDDREFYFLAGLGLEYVMKNNLIDGRLQENYERDFGDSKPWILHWRTGVVYARKAVTFAFNIYHLGPEFNGGSDHGYGSFTIAVRY